MKPSTDIPQNALPDESLVRTARPWLAAAAAWFVCTAVLGTVMRLGLAAGVTLPLPFDHLLHAHSHIALFGWVGSALTGLFYAVLPLLSGRPFGRPKRFAVHFVLLQVATAGALAAFLWQGYAGFSILFCTVHLFLWYYFALAVRRQFPAQALATSPALHLMRVAVISLVLSSLGTWALPFIMTGGGPSALLYRRMAIDFFVHTFADGWLIPAVLALALVATGVRHLHDPAVMKQVRANLLVYIPVVMVSSLRSTAYELPPYVQLSAAGASLLLGALHLHMLWLFRSRFRQPMLNTLALFLALKAVMEGIPAFPAGQELIGNRMVLIAYLHIKLLGIASIGVVTALYALCPPRKAARAVRWFTRGVAAMSVSLLVTCLPALPLHSLGLPLPDAALMMAAGQYGALLASVVLIGAGGALFAGFLQNGRTAEGTMVVSDTFRRERMYHGIADTTL